MLCLFYFYALYLLVYKINFFFQNIMFFFCEMKILFLKFSPISLNEMIDENLITKLSSLSERIVERTLSLALSSLCFFN